MTPKSNNNQDSTDDNDADDEEDPPNSYEDTELSDNEEIDHPPSYGKKVQDTNNSDESNDEIDVESDVQGENLLNENKGERQLENKRRNEALEQGEDGGDPEEEEEEDGDDQEEEDNEAEETDSGTTYVRKVIPFEINTYA